MLSEKHDCHLVNIIKLDSEQLSLLQPFKQIFLFIKLYTYALAIAVSTLRQMSKTLSLLTHIGHDHARLRRFSCFLPVSSEHMNS